MLCCSSSLQIVSVGKHVKGYHYIMANLVSHFWLFTPLILLLLSHGGWTQTLYRLLTFFVLTCWNNASTGDLWDQNRRFQSTSLSWFSSSYHRTQSWLLFLAPEGFQGHQLGAFHAWWRQRDRLPAGGLQQPHGHQTDAALEQAGPEGVPWIRRPAQGKQGHSLRESSDIYGFLLGWFPILCPGFIGIHSVAKTQRTHTSLLTEQFCNVFVPLRFIVCLCVLLCFNYWTIKKSFTC